MAQLDRATLQALEARLASVNDFSPRLKAFIYGPYGVGKTVTTAVIGSQLLKGTGKKTLFIDTSDGYRALKNHPKILPYVDAMPFTSLGAINKVVEAIASRQGKFANYGAIVLDEISTMTERHLISIQAKRYGGTNPDEMPPADWDDYRRLVTHMKGVMQFMYEDAGLHVFLVTHEKQEVKDNIVVKEAKPNLQPSVASAIFGDMDVIARQTSVRKRVDGDWDYVRELQAWPTKTIVAKSRIGGLPFQVGILEFTDAAISWLNREDSDTEIATPNFVNTDEEEEYTIGLDR